MYVDKFEWTVGHYTFFSNSTNYTIGHKYNSTIKKWWEIFGIISLSNRQTSTGPVCRVDIFHHSDEDEEDEGWSPQEALLLKTRKFDSIANCLRECCFFRTTHIGRWQKVVILVFGAVKLFLHFASFFCTNKVTFKKKKNFFPYFSLSYIEIFSRLPC